MTIEKNGLAVRIWWAIQKKSWVILLNHLWEMYLFNADLCKNERKTLQKNKCIEEKMLSLGHMAHYQLCT